MLVGLAKETIRMMHKAALEISNFDNRKAVVSHLLRSEAESRLRSMISLAQSEPGIAVTANDHGAEKPESFQTLQNTPPRRTPPA
jgi:hypothetical protein